MGEGDIKLAALFGAFLGFPAVLIALFFGYFVGGIIGLFLIITKIRGRADEVPFAPMLILGIFCFIFFGEFIVSWYLKGFLI